MARLAAGLPLYLSDQSAAEVRLSLDSWSSSCQAQLVARGRLHEAELDRAGCRLRARPAAELRERVPDVHVDGTRAEEELAGDLAIGASHGHVTQDLELAAREAARPEVGERAVTDPLVDPLA
jgi:hypothetical protein